MKKMTLACLLAIGVAAGSSSALAAGRVYVATATMGGDDANVANNCSIDFPCRLLATALTVVDDGGEMVILNSGQYGLVSINKSVAITAAPGIFTGIAPSTGVGIGIDAVGAEVRLRGLTIRGNGGSAAIQMVNGAKLTVENCLIYNFKTASLNGTAIEVISAGTELRVVNSVIRDNNYGVFIGGGGTAYVSNSVITGNAGTGNGVGIYAKGDAAGTTTTVHVTDSVVTGNYYGISAYNDAATASARAFVTRSMVSNNTWGIDADNSLGGTAASAYITGNSVNGNITGLSITGSGASMTSYGNNMISGNTLNISGAVTPAALQ